MEFCITRALGQPQRIVAYNTCQVKDYSRYELAGFSEEATFILNPILKIVWNPNEDSIKLLSLET